MTSMIKVSESEGSGPVFLISQRPFFVLRLHGSDFAKLQSHPGRFVLLILMVAGPGGGGRGLLLCMVIMVNARTRLQLCASLFSGQATAYAVPNLCRSVCDARLLSRLTSDQNICPENEVFELFRLFSIPCFSMVAF